MKKKTTKIVVRHVSKKNKVYKRTYVKQEGQGS